MNVIAPVTIATVLILSLVFTQLQPWRSAQLTEVGRPEDLIARMDIFPQFNAFRRAQLVEELAAQLDQVGDIDRRSDLVEDTEIEGLAAINIEPENMKFRIVMAGFYRSAAAAIPERRDEFVIKAREQTEKATSIGPHIFESLQNRVEQAFFEGDLPGIEQAVINEWKGAGWDGQFDRLFDTRLEEARAAGQ